MANPIASLPYYGIGIGFREQIADQTIAHQQQIDAVEIITENYFSPQKQENLEKLSALFPVIPHGIDLSIGSAERIDHEFLRKIKTICTLVKASYYTDHFAVTRLGERAVGHLSPIWFTRDSLDIVVDKINRIQDVLGIALAFENITSFFDIPHADFSEEEFISEVCAKTGCGILLDITNVSINAHNRKQDPYLFLKCIPLASVIQIHLAGGVITDNWFHDTHSKELNGVNKAVWPLLDWTLSRTPNLKTIIIERDENLNGDFHEIILNDMQRIRSSVSRLSNRLTDGDLL